MFLHAQSGKPENLNTREYAMNKKFISIALSVALGLASFQGCIGSFKLTGKVLAFNRGVSNKWVNELLFLLMAIVQVYTVTILIDALIINSLEFWSGTNPQSMKPGDIEVQYVKGNGKLFKIEATQNRFHIVQLEGENAGATADVIYNPETGTWLAGNGKEIRRIVQFTNDSKEAKIFKQDGSFVMVKTDSSQDDIYRSLELAR